MQVVRGHTAQAVCYISLGYNEHVQGCCAMTRSVMGQCNPSSTNRCGEDHTTLKTREMRVSCLPGLTALLCFARESKPPGRMSGTRISV